MILIFICYFVETIHQNKRLFIHPWPTVYMYFYTMQQNICFTTLNHIIIFNYTKKMILIFRCCFVRLFNKNVFFLVLNLGFPFIQKWVRHLEEKLNSGYHSTSNAQTCRGQALFDSACSHVMTTDLRNQSCV
jgi:hypothetical protein